MNGRLDITSEELTIYTKKRNKDSEELFSFIDKKAHPQIREKLKFLIEKYNGDFSGITCSENKLYYKAGFSDGIKLLLAALKE